MFDWKGKIDNFEENQRAAIKSKQSEDQKRKEEIEENARKESQKQIDSFIKKLGETFKCHICLTPATKPFSKWIPGRSNCEGDGTDGYEELDYSKPGNLFLCKICNRWTCEEHLYKNICKECAEKV